jgi:hypothetical protein
MPHAKIEMIYANYRVLEAMQLQYTMVMEDGRLYIVSKIVSFMFGEIAQGIRSDS